MVRGLKQACWNEETARKRPLDGREDAISVPPPAAPLVASSSVTPLDRPEDAMSVPPPGAPAPDMLPPAAVADPLTAPPPANAADMVPAPPASIAAPTGNSYTAAPSAPTVLGSLTPMPILIEVSAKVTPEQNEEVVSHVRARNHQEIEVWRQQAPDAETWNL